MKNQTIRTFRFIAHRQHGASACGGAARPRPPLPRKPPLQPRPLLQLKLPAATEAPAAEAAEVTSGMPTALVPPKRPPITALLEQAKTDLPNITINVLQVPFNDIYNKYRTDVAAGGRPDIFIAPNNSLGDDRGEVWLPILPTLPLASSMVLANLVPTA